MSYPEGGNQGINSVKVARKQKQQRKSPLLQFISALVRRAPKTIQSRFTSWLFFFLQLRLQYNYLVKYFYLIQLIEHPYFVTLREPYTRRGRQS